MYSFLIPTYNRPYIVQTLYSISQLINPGIMEVVVVVHFEAEEQIKRLYDFKQTSKLDINIVLTNTRNVPIARNISILSAKYEILIFVDDDCIVPMNYLNYLKNKDNADLIKGGVLFRTEDSYFSKAYSELRKDWYSNPEIPYTPNLIVKRNIFRKVGLYDEFSHGGEDIEWGIRAANHGIKPYFISNLILEHAEEKFEKKIIKTWLGYGKNKSYIFVKYLYTKNIAQCLRLLKRIFSLKYIKLRKGLAYNTLVMLVLSVQLLGFISHIPKFIRSKKEYKNWEGRLTSQEYVQYCLSFIVNGNAK
jgi:GT2 family glycosyltransferase